MIQNFVYKLKGGTPFFHADKHFQVITSPTLILADAAQTDNDLLHMSECAWPWWFIKMTSFTVWISLVPRLCGRRKTSWERGYAQKSALIKRPEVVNCRLENSFERAVSRQPITWKDDWNSILHPDCSLIPSPRLRKLNVILCHSFSGIKCNRRESFTPLSVTGCMSVWIPD